MEPTNRRNFRADRRHRDCRRSAEQLKEALEWTLTAAGAVGTPKMVAELRSLRREALATLSELPVEPDLVALEAATLELRRLKERTGRLGRSLIRRNALQSRGSRPDIPAVRPTGPLQDEEPGSERG
ncbi:MAG: hypothetical protein ACI9WU_004444 [Myxococcota bacterium]|jgi:hypothetical protein